MAPFWPVPFSLSCPLFAQFECDQLAARRRQGKNPGHFIELGLDSAQRRVAEDLPLDGEIASQFDDRLITGILMLAWFLCVRLLPGHT